MGKRLNYDNSNSSKKSAVKMAGIKSSLISGEKLVMTSFGKGNEAIIEKTVENGKIKNISEVSHFDLQFDRIKGESKFDINSGYAETDNPLYYETNPIGQDLIGAKSQLEKRYFGKEYPNDNLHIQLIYNILDIEKIIAVHINNIIYTINKLGKTEDSQDFFSVLSPRDKFEVYCNPRNYKKKDNDIKNMEDLYNRFKFYYGNKRLVYFADAFYEKSRETIKPRSEQDAFYILALLGDIRHFSMHDQEKGEYHNTDRYWLYSLEDNIDDGSGRYEAYNVLDGLYSNHINSINSNFITLNKKNLTILFQCYKATKPAKRNQLVNEFYNFAIKKDYKHLGFSIKKLREQLLSCEGFSQYKDSNFDSIRSHLYLLFDFAISKYLKNEDKYCFCDNLIKTLRCSSNKDKCYSDAAKYIQEDIKIIFAKIANIYNACKEMTYDDIDLNIDDSSINDNKLSDYGTHRFTKIIYLMTLFLSGKEINDLVTSLINKFDNISEFIKLIRNEEFDLSCEFEPQYAFFYESKSIVNELMLLQSFSKMTTIPNNASDVLIADAKELFGLTNTDSNQLENIIKSNVISSRYFKYIIRYMSPKDAAELAKNKKVVAFVLSELPEEQILRHYSAIFPNSMNSKGEMCSLLALQLCKISDSINKIGKTGDDKKRLVTLITLYLFVIYQITKNLVNINSRYALAFHILERDTHLFGGKTKNYFYMVDKFIADNQYLLGDNITRELEKLKVTLQKSNFNTRKKALYRKKKNIESLQRNIEYVKGNFNKPVKNFRNAVAHLNAVRSASKYIDECKCITSYYSLYHFILQCYVKENTNNINVSEFETITEYHSYNKDLVKYLCLCFGYNYPRYMNLTVEGLFDMNRPGYGK